MQRPFTQSLFLRNRCLSSVIGKSNTISTSSKTTYDYNQGNGKYDLINSSLTNDYRNTYGYANAGFRFRKQTKLIIIQLVFPGNRQILKARLLAT